MKNSAFDINLQEGQIYEAELKSILASPIEVKTEWSSKNGAMWKRTGNIAVEFESRGKPSGIAITEAEWWAAMLPAASGMTEVIVLVPVVKLKHIARKIFHDKGFVRGGDDKTSKIILIPISEIFK